MPSFQIQAILCSTPSLELWPHLYVESVLCEDIQPHTSREHHEHHSLECDCGYNGIPRSWARQGNCCILLSPGWSVLLRLLVTTCMWKLCPLGNALLMATGLPTPCGSRLCCPSGICPYILALALRTSSVLYLSS